MIWSEVVQAWSTDPNARLVLADKISSTPHEAVFWETSPSVTGDEPFEQALVPAPGLARMRSDPQAFAEHLSGGVCAFDNLRGDTRLIAPPETGNYPHLLAFLRSAEEPLIHELFILMAAEIAQWWADPTREVLWVSTHGAAVPWLHVRLDPRAKYYRSDLQSRG